MHRELQKIMPSKIGGICVFLVLVFCLVVSFGRGRLVFEKKLKRWSVAD